MMRASYLPESNIVVSDDFCQPRNECLTTHSYIEYIRSISNTLSHPALIFLLENQSQIEQKANKFGVDFADVCQDMCLIFIEKASSFDSSRGTLKNYIFGHLEKILHRQTIGVLRFAVSLDDDNEGVMRRQVESYAVIEPNETDSNVRKDAVPGQQTLRDIANIISGKSLRELAADRGVSRRQMHNVLTNILEHASVQADLNFDDETY